MRRITAWSLALSLRSISSPDMIQLLHCARKQQSSGSRDGGTSISKDPARKKRRKRSSRRRRRWRWNGGSPSMGWR